MVFDVHGPAPLKVESTRNEPDTLLTPAGELDVATAEHLGDTVLLAGIASKGLVTLDLSKLRFIDVTGVRTVVEVAHVLGSRLRLIPGRPHVQRVFQLTGVESRLPFLVRDNVTPFPGAAERNLKYVRRIWDVFLHEGLEAFIQAVPPQVEWRPLESAPRVLRGSEELRAFYGCARTATGRRPNRFSLLGDDVLVQTVRVQTESALERREDSSLFSLYEFDRGILVRQTSFAREQDVAARGQDVAAREQDVAARGV